MTPDERYIEDQECWPHGTPGDAASATVTAIPLVDGGRVYEPQDARPEPSDEQQRAEALCRLATHLRQSIDAQKRALADIGDIMEALR